MVYVPVFLLTVGTLEGDDVSIMFFFKRRHRYSMSQLRRLVVLGPE